MGLGMMASQKPGLSGVGEGALTGLKTVAPLLTKKASDFQIVEVADKDNPGQTKLVKINKRTNEIVDLGVGGKGTEVASIKKLKYEAAELGIDVDDLIRFRLTKSDKSKQEQVLELVKYIWGQDVLSGLGATQEDLVNYKEQATELINMINEIPNDTIDKLLKE